MNRTARLGVALSALAVLGAASGCKSLAERMKEKAAAGAKTNISIFRAKQ